MQLRYETTAACGPSKLKNLKIKKLKMLLGV